MANSVIRIGDREIGNNDMPYFIAEIGINHNGDMQIAKKLMDAAFCCGWDCVKFQKRNPDKAVPEAQKGVMRSTPWGEMTYLDYKKHIEFEKKEYDEIDRYCKDKPLMWTASPWDLDSLDFLMQYDVPFIKLASAANGSDELIKAACKTGRPIFMSDGMSTQEELDHAVSLLEDFGNGDYVLLHTNSTYPAAVDTLNLSYMQTMKERYGCIVGYSGHEQNLEPTVAACILGAKVIERHVTLSHDLWGTDQKASLEINAMYMLRRRCMDIPAMIGDGVKTMDEGEKKIREKLKGY